MLLWLTRKYPPAVGGMERLNYELTRELSRRLSLHLIAWGRSQRGLPFFITHAAFTALQLRRRGMDIQGLHLGDALLTPAGAILSSVLGGVRLTTIACGLDVTFPAMPYQLGIRPSLRRCAAVMCISDATRREVIRRGVDPEKCSVIPCGASDGPRLALPEPAERQLARSRLVRRFELDLGTGPVLLTVGRLVQRKGVAWFVERVLPELACNVPGVSYLVVGRGPYRRRIEEAARRSGVAERILLLGHLAEDDVRLAYAAADLFVMPNVPMPADPEGFGIAALDASVAGLWVVATRLDGIPDAVRDDRNGLTLAALDARAWCSTLTEMLGDPIGCRRAGTDGRQFTLNHFGWPSIADRYFGEFARLGMAS